MNVVNTLIRLRDDLKDWTTHNILALQTLIPTKISDLANDEKYITEDYIEEMQLTLGVHTDGLVYLFKNNEPIGNGVQLGGEVVAPPTNLMKIGEIYLNQRYSKSGGGLVSDDKSVGMFSIIFPFETDGKTTHILDFKNMNFSLKASTNNTMFLLDANKSNPVNVNGNNSFTGMGSAVVTDSSGVGTVTFANPSADRKYIVVSLLVAGSTITEVDIANYVITLD